MMTQGALAEAADMDLKFVQRIEYGTARPTVETIVRVAHAIGVSFWDLMASTAPPIENPRGRGRPRGRPKKGTKPLLRRG